MKQNVKQHLLRVGAALALVSAAVWPTAGAAAPVSPVGTWDCIVNGYPGVGLAYVTFVDDFTLSGYQLLTVVPPAPPTPVVSNPDARNSGGDVGRNTASGYGRFVTTTDSGTGSPTTTYSACTMRLGLTQLTGSWNYDVATGRVIGYLQQIIATTNTAATLTNSAAGFQTNTIGSFVATVLSGSRLWLVASTPCGRAVYTGVPIPATIPDLTGSWFAFDYHGGQKAPEFFDVAPGSQPFLFTIVNGVGTNYTFSGDIMVSSWRRAAFSIVSGTNGVVRYTGGSFNPLKFSAMTVGQEGGARVNYNAAMVPVTTP